MHNEGDNSSEMFNLMIYIYTGYPALGHILMCAHITCCFLLATLSCEFLWYHVVWNNFLRFWCFERRQRKLTETQNEEATLQLAGFEQYDVSFLLWICDQDLQSAFQHRESDLKYQKHSDQRQAQCKQACIFVPTVTAWHALDFSTFCCDKSR